MLEGSSAYCLSSFTKYQQVERMCVHSPVSGRFLLFLFAGCTRRTGYIPFFINEIKELVVTFDGIWHEYPGFTLSGFGFLAHIPIAIKEIKVFLVVPFQIQFFNFLCHTPF